MKHTQLQYTDGLDADAEREEIQANPIFVVGQLATSNPPPKRNTKQKFQWACLILLCFLLGALMLYLKSNLLQETQLMKQAIQQMKAKVSKKSPQSSSKKYSSDQKIPQSSSSNQHEYVEPSSQINSQDSPVQQPETSKSIQKQLETANILSYQLESTDEKEAFVIPKKLWMYQNKDKSFLSTLIVENNKYFATQSGFQPILINRDNYRNYASPKTEDQVEKFIKSIQGMSSNRIPVIIRTFILLNLINQNGGVMTDGETVLTESFNWMRQISNNIHVNRGTRQGIKPQVVGFYSLEYTLDKEKENIKPFPGMNEVDKYMSLFPSMEEYFIAADKNTAFITEIIDKITTVIKNPEVYQRKKNEYKVKKITGNDPFFEFLYISSQMVLQDRQKLIDAQNKESYRKFAIDYYGLNLINCYHGPYKNQYFWGNDIKQEFIWLTQIDLNQLLASFGPTRYVMRMSSFNQFNKKLQATRDKGMKPILEGSFIQKTLFPKNDVALIQKNKEKPFINQTNEAWTTLPKIIWVFYDRGIENSRLSNQMCVQNMRRMGKLSGFVVNEVSVANAHQYLDQKTLQKIRYTMANAKLRTYTPSLSDLYRLALVSKHGGLYLDSTFLLLQSLDWLVNIGRYPSQHIFNRYSHLPKVLMLFYPNSASPFDWYVDEKQNTKSIWQIGYESSFIAAEKGNELVTEWFEMLTRLYILPYHEVAKIFQTQCKIKQYQWMTQWNHYLIVMDSIKCVIARKQQALVSAGKNEYASASDYYKLWSMNGNLGQQKLRTKTNFEHINSKDIKLCYRYSQKYTEGLVGKFHEITKFYGSQATQMANFAGAHLDGNYLGEAHPDSVFMRYMWHDNFYFQHVNGQPRLKIRS